ncbi:MAG: NUDIX domain-containing protein [Oscillospiraceae bacterium]|nr:NUDIX domain-containing protein [Oscillospiraceae bacterium]
MELWDVYDENRNPLGRTIRRGSRMKKGEYHLVVFVWVFNSRGQLLLTKRSPEKRSFPNKWDPTGGAVQRGENSLQAVQRELFEETGIRAAQSEFELIDTYRRAGKNDICDVYFLRKDVGLDELVMQEGETCGAMWVSRQELERMIAQDMVAKPDAFRYRSLGEKLNGYLK